MRRLGVIVAAGVLAMAAMPAGAQPQEAARPGDGLLAGWQRIDAHTLRRVDVTVAAAQWQLVDAHRWRLEPGAAPRAVASR